MKEINVLSLFDGISCGQIALERAGIKVGKYYASEIDKYAIKVAQANYPDTIQLGCIKDIDINMLYEIDLLIGGSPCQGFSFAGKQLNFKDSRSKLFFEYVRILEMIKPEWFLLENVKMKKEFQDIISKIIGVQPIEINSALVSAQNRKRLYWTNIFNIIQPQDRNILLKDILQDIIFDDKYILSNIRVKYIKSRPINYACKLNPDKTNTLRTNYGNASANETFVTVDRDKSYYLDANYHKGANWNQYKKKSRRQLIGNELSWRKLTPVECERLQTVPDNYTNHVSNTQRYKMLGNGFTVDVIAHILRNMN